MLYGIIVSYYAQKTKSVGAFERDREVYMKKRRISGMDMDSAQGVPYAAEADGGKWEMDLDAVKKKIGGYIDKDDETKKYSLSGLCIALGITRETLGLWRMGYASEEDFSDERVCHNRALADCVAKAELYVHRYWEECEESKLQTKHVKLLESAGVFEKSRRVSTGPPFDLGSLKKYAR